MLAGNKKKKTDVEKGLLELKIIKKFPRAFVDNRDTRFEEKLN